MAWLTLWLVDIRKMESRIEAEIREILLAQEFKPYHEVFDLFGFGLRIRSRLLSRIYPFESFLLPSGRLWIEREYREAKKTQKELNDGTIKVKFAPGDVKRVKKNLLRGKHIQGKCMAKTANLMFKEFVKMFVTK